MGLNHPEPECPLGYPIDQLKRVLTEQEFKRLALWMHGQTMAICEGRRYDHDKRVYEPDACADHPHGTIVYPWDFGRWLQAGPIVD